MGESFEKTPVTHAMCDEKHHNVNKSITGMVELYSRFAQSQEKHNDYMRQMQDKLFDKIDEINRQGLGVKIVSVEKSLEDHKCGFGHWKPMAFIGGIIMGTAGLFFSFWQMVYRK